MNGLAKIGTKMSRTLLRCKPVAKAVAKVNKNKPEILAVCGGAAILVAFGWAIYEAIGVKDVMEETNTEIEEINERYSKKPEPEQAALEKQHTKELKAAKIKGVWRVTKKFVGPGATLIVGMGLGAKSIKIFRARNIFLSGALKGTQEAYKFYRQNVREDLGEEADKKYARGIIGEKEIEEKITDADGKEKTVKTKIPVVKENDNPWRFEFCEDLFRTWKPSTEQNLFILHCEQEWWKHEFERTEEVSMYEVLKHLGYKFEVRKAGMTKAQYRDFMNFVRNYGWKKGSGGDEFIDFGIYRAINEPAIRGMSDVVWLEFNCDGNLNKI